MVMISDKLTAFAYVYVCEYNTHKSEMDSKNFRKSLLTSFVMNNCLKSFKYRNCS